MTRIADWPVQRFIICPGASILHISGHSILQKLDQFRLHEVIVIGNVEDSKFLFFEKIAKPLGNLVPVRFLHDKNCVCPFDQITANWSFCVGVRSGADSFNIPILSENCCGSRTSKAIFTANEENSHSIQVPINRFSSLAPVAGALRAKQES